MPDPVSRTRESFRLLGSRWVFDYTELTYFLYSQRHWPNDAAWTGTAAQWKAGKQLDWAV